LCPIRVFRHIVTKVAAPVIDYQHGFAFALTPTRLWERIEEVDQFELWWPWLSQCDLEGNGLAQGSVLRGVISPPVPYRMRVWIEFGECVPSQSLEAMVGGDLTGVARLKLRPEAGGTWAEVAWTLEMQKPAMRMACRFGYPLLRRGHDRVVEMTVAGLRRRIEA
jgi:hypothetical protein